MISLKQGKSPRWAHRANHEARRHIVECKLCLFIACPHIHTIWRECLIYVGLSKCYLTNYYLVLTTLDGDEFAYIRFTLSDITSGPSVRFFKPIMCRWHGWIIISVWNDGTQIIWCWIHSHFIWLGGFIYDILSQSTFQTDRQTTPLCSLFRSCSYGYHIQCINSYSYIDLNVLATSLTKGILIYEAHHSVHDWEKHGMSLCKIRPKTR